METRAIRRWDSRSRDLLVRALDAVALQEKEIAIEHDPGSPARSVTLTMSGRSCKLDIDGVEPRAPAPPSEDETCGLQLLIGRWLTPVGAEIDGVGVEPDVQPACLAGDQARAGEDCLLRFAQDVVAQARDAQRATLLSTAKSLANQGTRRSAVPARP